jgi:hypothetical protein
MKCTLVSIKKRRKQRRDLEVTGFHGEIFLPGKTGPSLHGAPETAPFSLDHSELYPREGGAGVSR